MKTLIAGTSIPQPTEIMSVLRELAPDLCKNFDTLVAFQRYVWNEKDLKEIKVHPRQEMFARLWCEPPPELTRGNVRQVPIFTLHIEDGMPEYEMHLIFKDGECKIIELEK